MSCIIQFPCLVEDKVSAWRNNCYIIIYSSCVHSLCTQASHCAVSVCVCVSGQYSKVPSRRAAVPTVHVKEDEGPSVYFVREVNPL